MENVGSPWFFEVLEGNERDRGIRFVSSYRVWLKILLKNVRQDVDIFGVAFYDVFKTELRINT